MLYIAEELAVIVAFIVGCWYAYRIATRPIERTWIEVAIGFCLVFALFIVLLFERVVRLGVMGWTLPPASLTAILAWSYVKATVVFGVPMILGQELKKRITEDHWTTTKRSMGLTRSGWESTAHHGDEEETVAEEQGDEQM